MARKFPTTLKKPDPQAYKGWTFVLVLAGILTVAALFHRGTLDTVRVTEPAPSTSATATAAPAPPSGACQFEVTIDNLNVRSSPRMDGNPVQTLNRGQRVPGTATVQNGYRELEGSLWALDQHLAPVPNTCT